MQLSAIPSATQSSTHFFIPIPVNLTAEGIAAYLFKCLLDELSGELASESGENITDENGNYLYFDNSKLYPEMSLIYWRNKINGNWLEMQIVFFKREAA
jgi:hypothetical protein